MPRRPPATVQLRYVFPITESKTKEEVSLENFCRGCDWSKVKIACLLRGP